MPGASKRRILAFFGNTHATHRTVACLQGTRHAIRTRPACGRDARTRGTLIDIWSPVQTRSHERREAKRTTSARLGDFAERPCIWSVTSHDRIAHVRHERCTQHASGTCCHLSDLFGDGRRQLLPPTAAFIRYRVNLLRRFSPLIGVTS